MSHIKAELKDFVVRLLGLKPPTVERSDSGGEKKNTLVNGFGREGGEEVQDQR